LSGPSTSELERMFYLRAAGLFEVSSIAAQPAKLLMQSSLVGNPVDVQGRLYHGVQVSGIGTTGQQVQIHASLDGGVTWSQLGATITADGIVQLPSGAYTHLKAVLSTPGGTTTAEILTAGEVDIDCTSAASFPTAGLALIEGSDLVSYTGKAANTLTGVPATGDLASLDHIAGVAIRPANLAIALVSFR